MKYISLLSFIQGVRLNSVHRSVRYKWVRVFFLGILLSIFLPKSYSQLVEEVVLYHTKDPFYGIIKKTSGGFDYYYPMEWELVVGNIEDNASVFGRGYIEFDISHIPKGAIVNSVKIKLLATHNNFGGVQFRRMELPLMNGNDNSRWNELAGDEVVATAYVTGSGNLELGGSKLTSILTKAISTSQPSIQFGLHRDAGSHTYSTRFDVNYYKNTSLTVSYTLGVPSHPRELEVSNVSNIGCELSWEAPIGEIKAKGYDLFLDGVFVGTVSSSARSYNFSGLASNKNYTLGVCAINEAGRSETTSSIIFKTKPSVPKNIVQKHVGCGQYEISWSSSDYDEQGVQYFVYLNDSEYGSTTYRKIVLEGLNDFATYKVKVKSENVAGVSNFSSIINLSTVSSVKPSAPISPRIIKIPVAGVGYQLSWQDDANESIDFYRIIERSPKSGLVGNVTEKRILLNYLGDSEMYIFTVQAVKDLCASDQLTWGFHTGYLKSIGINDEFRDVQMVDVEESSDLLVTPNPVRDQLSITGFSDFLFEIYSINGAVKYSGHSSDGTVNVSSLSSGFYILSLIKGEEVRSFKFVKL